MKSKKLLPHQQYLASLNKPFKEHTKEERLEYLRLYKLTNSEKNKEYQKAYYLNNSEKIKEQIRKWHLENRNHVNKWRKERYHNNLEFKDQVKLRVWIHNNIKRGKGTEKSWVKNIGCSKNEFKVHIESQFNEGMTWDNWSRNGWHIDHIVPLSKGGTNHYTNLQPLWAKDNLAKGNKELTV